MILSPKVSSSPWSRKFQFLSVTKGITSEELLEAIKRQYGTHSKEYQVLEQGLRQGKTITQVATEMDEIEPKTAAAPSPASAASGGAVSSTSTSTIASSAPYAYAPPPPGFVTGPPAFPGGPPTFYPLPSAASTAAAAPAAGSTWKTVAWTTAGVLGGIAAAGVAAHKLMGFELTRKEPNQVTPPTATDATNASSLASAMPNSTDLAPLASSSSSSTALVVDSRFGDSTKPTSSGSSDVGYDDEPEEKYLSAWLGESAPASTRVLTAGSSTDSLAVEVRLLGEKLDSVIECLKENQLELRKLSSRPISDNQRLEQLLTQSGQTQTDMLATLKIMMAAQARASKEAAAAAAAQAVQAVQPTPSATTTPMPSATPTSSISSSGTGGSLFAPYDPALARATSVELSNPSIAIPSPDGAPSFSLSSSTSSTSASSSSTFSSPIDSDPLVDGLRNLEESLSFLYTNNTPDEIKLACAAMGLYIENLLNHISEPRYRKILLTNSSYEQRVRKVKGAERYLLAAGFEINKPYLEWLMPDATSETPSIASGSITDGTGTGLIMNESQKTKQLQQALQLLRAFQTKVADGSYEPTTKSVSNAATTPTADTKPPVTTVTNAQQPISQPQAPPSTSYSAYASMLPATPMPTDAQSPSSTPTNVSVGVPQATSIVPPPVAANGPASSVASLDSESIQVPNADAQGQSSYQHAWQAHMAQQQQQQQQQSQQPITAEATVAAAQTNTTNRDENETQSQQQQQPPSNYSSSSSSSHPASQPLYGVSQAFSYPNTPAQSYLHTGVRGMQMGDYTQSYPNTPLGPPQLPYATATSSTSLGAGMPPPTFQPNTVSNYTGDATANGMFHTGITDTNNIHPASMHAHGVEHLLQAASQVNPIETKQPQPQTA